MGALAKFFICFFSFKLEETLIRRMAIVHNVPSIADGGALSHQSLIEKQKLKICKQIN